MNKPDFEISNKAASNLKNVLLTEEEMKTLIEKNDKSYKDYCDQIYATESWEFLETYYSVFKDDVYTGDEEKLREIYQIFICAEHDDNMQKDSKKININGTCREKLRAAVQQQNQMNVAVVIKELNTARKEIEKNLNNSTLDYWQKLSDRSSSEESKLSETQGTFFASASPKNHHNETPKACCTIL